MKENNYEQMKKKNSNVGGGGVSLQKRRGKLMT